MASQASLLLQKQLKDLCKHPVDGFSAGLVDENNIFEWSVTIIGPPDTLYFLASARRLLVLTSKNCCSCAFGICLVTKACQQLSLLVAYVPCYVSYLPVACYPQVILNLEIELSSVGTASSGCGCGEGGFFNAIMSFPPNYPNSPPTVKFTSEIWHPNVYPDGRVCISILHPPGDDPNGYELASERWMPVHTVESIVLSIISMLSSPNDESPANVEAAKEWRERKDEFKRKGDELRLITPQSPCESRECLKT
ncbi:hypothetical protein GOBAR_AA16662 [Gossypium barbadense]|uniref:UBC core domain-containing protein n=2 Tax=Gossypium TaxID=3633 RepID=A0A2P5XKY4_GOSBA|nr:hypothetical protein GOBAR_AA16662 [Gossypium barbadense]